MDPAEILRIADDAARRSHPLVADDVRSDVTLALYQLGGETEAAARAEAERVRRGLHKGWKRRPAQLEWDVPAREDEGPGPGPEPGPGAGSGPRKRTAGQRRRLERDVVIAAAARQGVPHRAIARVFGLARSRVGAIVKGFGG